LRVCGPRLGDKNLIGVQDHFSATRTSDVGRDVSKKSWPADDAANQLERKRVFNEVGEDWIAAQNVPDALIGIVVRIVEPEFLFPFARPVLGGGPIERVSRRALRCSIERRVEKAQSMFPD